MRRWYMTRADLTDARHPGDEHLAKEFVLHRHLSEEVVDFIVLAIRSAPFPDHVGKNKTGLCRERERERAVNEGQLTSYGQSGIVLFKKKWFKVFRIMLDIEVTIEP